jgi:hypothetical protein
LGVHFAEAQGSILIRGSVALPAEARVVLLVEGLRNNVITAGAKAIK